MKKNYNKVSDTPHLNLLSVNILPHVFYLHSHVIRSSVFALIFQLERDTIDMQRVSLRCTT